MVYTCHVLVNELNAFLHESFSLIANELNYVLCCRYCEGGNSMTGDRQRVWLVTKPRHTCYFFLLKSTDLSCKQPYSTEFIHNLPHSLTILLSGNVLMIFKIDLNTSLNDYYVCHNIIIYY
jgi:hypothetical protein